MCVRPTTCVSRIDEVVARLNAPLPEVPAPHDVSHNGLVSNFTQDEYKTTVEKAKSILPPVIFFRWSSRSACHAGHRPHPSCLFYRALRMHNPSPIWFLCASLAASAACRCILSRLAQKCTCAWKRHRRVAPYRRHSLAGLDRRGGYSLAEELLEDEKSGPNTLCG